MLPANTIIHKPASSHVPSFRHQGSSRKCYWSVLVVMILVGMELLHACPTFECSRELPSCFRSPPGPCRSGRSKSLGMIEKVRKYHAHDHNCTGDCDARLSSYGIVIRFIHTWLTWYWTIDLGARSILVTSRLVGDVVSTIFVHPLFWKIWDLSWHVCTVVSWLKNWSSQKRLHVV